MLVALGNNMFADVRKDGNRKWGALVTDGDYALLTNKGGNPIWFKAPTKTQVVEMATEAAWREYR